MTQVNLQLRIENKGELTGTSGWLKNEVFKNAHLSIRKLKSGFPGLFLIGKNKDGSETKDLICFVSANPENTVWYQHYGYDFWAIYATEDYNQTGFTDSFTPAALDIFDKFIDECVELLKEFWNSDAPKFQIEIKADRTA